MSAEGVQNYLAILKIRRAASRRDTHLVGGVFLLVLVFTLAVGLLDYLNARALYLMAAMLIALGTGFGMSWVRLQVVSGSIETIELMQRTH
jgi:hypothetical protein